MKSEPGRYSVVERMVFLARQLGTKSPEPSREAQFVSALERHIAGYWRWPFQRRQAAWALAFAAASFGIFFWLRATGGAPLSYRVSDGQLSEAFIVGKAGTSVAFSDGSRLDLARGAQARIDEVTSHGARVELGDGEIALDIIKAEGNAWFVEAGPYEVRVTGTAFDVRWNKEKNSLEVDLHRGSVVVTGPHIDGPLRLQPGQRLTSATHGSTAVTRRSAQAALGSPRTKLDTPVEPAAAADPEQAADPSAAAPELGAAALDRREPATTAGAAAVWSRLVAQGEFQQVLAAARTRGIDNVLSTGPQKELAALADAARYGRNTELARRTLLAERKRFPKAAAARGVAFFLGGIEADGSAAALSWYETYLSESPSGSYAPQALGRRMMLVHRRSGTAASAPLARDYLKRFAQGPYASAAHKILEQSPE